MFDHQSIERVHLNQDGCKAIMLDLNVAAKVGVEYFNRVPMADLHRYLLEHLITFVNIHSSFAIPIGNGVI